MGKEEGVNMQHTPQGLCCFEDYSLCREAVCSTTPQHDLTRSRSFSMSSKHLYYVRPQYLICFSHKTEQNQAATIRYPDKFLGAGLPSIQYLYRSKLRQPAVLQTAHLGPDLSKLLPSGSQCRDLVAKKQKNKHNFFPEKITLINI